MLDIKFIRENTEKVKNVCRIKKDNADIDKIIALDDERRAILAEVEDLKRQRNEASVLIAQKKKSKENADDIIAKMQNVSTKIKELDDNINVIVCKRDEIMAQVPNIPAENVPHGESEKDNISGELQGKIPQFNFEPKDHLQIAEKLGLFDFPRGAKISGSGFPVLSWPAWNQSTSAVWASSRIVC